MLEDGILRGTFAEGAALPSTTALSRQQGVNPATVGRAFHQLILDRVIVKRRGIGMFVAPGARTSVRQRRRDELFADTLESVRREAALLDVEPAELAGRLLRRD
jgi:DNA-binding transcriptional regulator YhcF (GntR family)